MSKSAVSSIMLVFLLLISVFSVVFYENSVTKELPYNSSEKMFPQVGNGEYIIVNSTETSGSWSGVVAMFNLSIGTQYNIQWQLQESQLGSNSIVDSGTYSFTSSSTSNYTMITLNYNSTVTMQYQFSADLEYYSNGTNLDSGSSFFTVGTPIFASINTVVSATPSVQNAYIYTTNLLNSSYYSVNWTIGNQSGTFTLNSSSSMNTTVVYLGGLSVGTYCIYVDLFENGNITDSSYDCFAVGLPPNVYAVTQGPCALTSCNLSIVAENLHNGTNYMLNWELSDGVGPPISMGGNSWLANTSTNTIGAFFSNLNASGSYCLLTSLHNNSVTPVLIDTDYYCFSLYSPPVTPTPIVDTYLYNVPSTTETYAELVLHNLTGSGTGTNAYMVYWGLNNSNGTTLAGGQWPIVTPFTSPSFTMIYNASTTSEFNLTNVTTSPDTYCFAVGLYDYSTNITYYDSSCTVVSGVVGTSPSLDLTAYNVSGMNPFNGSYFGDMNTFDEVLGENYTLQWQLFDDMLGTLIDNGNISWYSNSSSSNFSIQFPYLPTSDYCFEAELMNSQNSGVVIDSDYFCFNATAPLPPTPSLDVDAWLGTNSSGHSEIIGHDLKDGVTYALDWNMYGSQSGVISSGQPQWHQNNMGSFLGTYTFTDYWPHLSPDTYCVSASLWEDGNYVDADQACFTVSPPTYMGGSEHVNITAVPWSDSQSSGVNVTIGSGMLVAGENYIVTWGIHFANTTAIVNGTTHTNSWMAYYPGSFEYTEYLLSPGYYCQFAYLELDPSDNSSNIPLAYNLHTECYTVPDLEQPTIIGENTISWTNTSYDSGSTVNGTILSTNLMIDSYYKLEWELRHMDGNPNDPTAIDYDTLSWVAYSTQSTEYLGWDGLADGEYCLITTLYLVENDNSAEYLHDYDNDCFTISSSGDNQTGNGSEPPATNLECPSPYVLTWDSDSGGYYYCDEPEQENGTCPSPTEPVTEESGPACHTPDDDAPDCPEPSIYVVEDGGMDTCQAPAPSVPSSNGTGNGTYDGPTELICDYNYHVVEGEFPNDPHMLDNSEIAWISYDVDTIITIQKSATGNPMSVLFHIHCNVDASIEMNIGSDIKDGSGFDGTNYYAFFIMNTPSDYPGPLYTLNTGVTFVVDNTLLGTNDDLILTEEREFGLLIVESTKVPPVCEPYYGTNIGTISSQGTVISSTTADGDYTVVLSPGMYVVGVFCEDSDGDDIVLTLETPLGDVVETGDSIWAVGSATVPNAVGQVNLDYSWVSGTDSGSGTITLQSTVTDSGGSGGTFEIVEDSGDDGNAIPSIGFLSTLLVGVICAVFVSLKETYSRRQD